jgi:uncharacterized protein (DUF58 family)
MTRPTLRCVLVFAGGIPASLCAVLFATQLWTLWVAYVGVVCLFVGLDAVLMLPRKRIALTTTIPDTLYIGDEDPLKIELAARGWKRAAALNMVADLGADLEPIALQRVVIAAGERTTVELPLTPRRRGTVSIDRIWLQWHGPLGLMRKQKVQLVGKKVAVVPNVRAVRTAALRWFSTRDFLSGLKVEQYIGDGSEFEALREYTPGLDHRAINWKASARHRKLLCQEFRAERNHQVVLAVDTGRLMNETMAGIPKLDHAINSGLLLSYFCLRTGDRVGLFGFDERVRCFAEPTGGLGSFPRLQHLSAELRYRNAETNFTLGLTELSTRLRRRSLIILLTDFVDTITAELMYENVYRLSRKHLVLFVSLRDPSLAALVAARPHNLGDVHRAVVADDFAREREVVLQRLRRHGVHSIDAPPRQVSIDLLNRYLEIRRRELI